MEKLAIRTRNSLYEITIIEGRSGEILLRGGHLFPELTPTRLTGATLGGSFCKMRGIYVGFWMEINANGQRFVMTPVESIGIMPCVCKNQLLESLRSNPRRPAKSHEAGSVESD